MTIRSVNFVFALLVAAVLTACTTGQTVAPRLDDNGQASGVIAGPAPTDGVAEEDLAEDGDVEASDSEPNVLLVILDDIGLDWFPNYLEGEGFDKATMPTLAGLMDDGFVFEGLHTYPTCSPTRASLLTGRHGVDTGVLDAGRTSRLSTEFPSIQDELKARSGDAIATSVFGKWHLAGNRAGDLDHPNTFGIDHYEGLIRGTHDSYDEWAKVTNGVETAATTYSTTEFTNDAIDWIADQDQQWFTWLAYTAPHTPIHLPPADLHTQEGLRGTEQDVRRNSGAYFNAMLESVDTEIGRLLDSLDPETREETFVFVIGDNGTGKRMSQEPFRSVGAKDSLHVGGINTPMIAYSPFDNGGGTRFDSLVSTIDFFPSILEVFGLESDLDLAGNSFAPLISGAPDDYVENGHVFSQNTEGVAVRTETHKLIRLAGGEERFYDASADRYEQVDLLAAGALDGAAEVAYASMSDLLDRYLDGEYGSGANPDLGDAPDDPSAGDTSAGDPSVDDTAADDTAGDGSFDAGDDGTIVSDYLGSYSLDDPATGSSTLVEVGDGVRRIAANGLPNHDTGEFPTRGNPNEISAQDVTYEFPLVPAFTGRPLEVREPGVALNGVKFEPGTAETVSCASGEVYAVEAFQDLLNLGLDHHNAHVQPSGAYHYHGLPFGVIDHANRGEDLVHLGFARDGHLIVHSRSGAYAPSYRLSDVPRAGTDCVVSGPRGNSIEIDGTTPDGMFGSDWEFDQTVGDLDQCNGIEIDGQYVYLVTERYPYISRCLMAEFTERQRRGPGNG